MLKKGAVAGLSISGNEMAMKGAGLTIAPSVIVFYTRPIKISKKQTFSPEIYLISSPLTNVQRLHTTNYDRNISIFTGGGTDVRVTKTFKFNLNLKVNISTDPTVPPMTAFTIGSKINL